MNSIVHVWNFLLCRVSLRPPNFLPMKICWTCRERLSVNYPTGICTTLWGTYVPQGECKCINGLHSSNIRHHKEIRKYIVDWFIYNEKNIALALIVQFWAILNIYTYLLQSFIEYLIFPFISPLFHELSFQCDIVSSFTGPSPWVQINFCWEEPCLGILSGYLVGSSFPHSEIYFSIFIIIRFQIA